VAVLWSNSVVEHDHKKRAVSTACPYRKVHGNGVLGFSMEAALRLVELREAESLNQAEAKYRAVPERRNEIGSFLQVRTQVGNDSGFSSMEELLSGSTFVTMA